MPPFPASRIAPASLHRPRARVISTFGFGSTLRRAPKPFRSAHRIDPWLRRRRFLIEAVATVLATTFLTSLALAHPAVLRNDPGTTLQAVGSQLLPSLVASPSPLLHDCP